jgi:hypothetical protein
MLYFERLIPGAAVVGEAQEVVETSKGMRMYRQAWTTNGDYPDTDMTIRLHGVKEGTRLGMMRATPGSVALKTFERKRSFP